MRAQSANVLTFNGNSQKIYKLCTANELMRPNLSKATPLAIGVLAGGILGSTFVFSIKSTPTLEEAIQVASLREYYLADKNRTIRGIRFVYDADRSKFVEYSLAHQDKVHAPRPRDGTYVLVPLNPDPKNYEKDLRTATTAISFNLYPQDFGQNSDIDIFVHPPAFDRTAENREISGIFLETELESALQMARGHKMGRVGDVNVHSDIAAGLAYHGVLHDMLRADGLRCQIDAQVRRLGAAQVSRVDELKGLIENIQGKKIPPLLDAVVKSWATQYRNYAEPPVR